jgi:L-lactate dehydrogenase complex protein LldF
VLLRLLCRSATGQAITAYVSFIGGPRPPGETDGPEELHLVILDGGRSAMWADPARREALRCIRCGACLNFCPVYERIGGHAYGWVYPGPIGAVITPGMIGIDQARELPQASSLCGRCGEVCPVKIPLPELLLVNRAQEVEQGKPGPAWGERLAMRLLALAATSPLRWRIGGALLRLYLRLALWKRPAAQLFGPLGPWTRYRNFPRPERRTFRALFRKESGR